MSIQSTHKGGPCRAVDSQTQVSERVVVKPTWCFHGFASVPICMCMWALCSLFLSFSFSNSLAFVCFVCISLYSRSCPGTCYGAQAGLRLAGNLLPTLEFCDYRGVPPRLAFLNFPKTVVKYTLHKTCHFSHFKVYNSVPFIPEQICSLFSGWYGHVTRPQPLAHDPISHCPSTHCPLSFRCAHSKHIGQCEVLLS